MQKTTRSLYHGHRFPAVVISQAVRWYFRFQLSLRDIEELLFERGRGSGAIAQMTAWKRAVTSCAQSQFAKPAFPSELKTFSIRPESRTI